MQDEAGLHIHLFHVYLLKMGKGGKGLASNGLKGDSVKSFTWDEIEKHDKRTDSWIVIEGKVYNVTNFMRKHPGGARVLSTYGGQDATVRILYHLIIYRLCFSLFCFVRYCWSFLIICLLVAASINVLYKIYLF